LNESESVEPLISDELLRDAAAHPHSILAEGEPKKLLGKLRTYESKYVALNKGKEDGGVFPEMETGELEGLSRAFEELLPIVEAMASVDGHVLASKLALLCHFLGQEAGICIPDFWEKCVSFSRTTDGYFSGTEFFYKIMGDILERETQRGTHGESTSVRIVSFTPMLFLPTERYSVGRIYAFKRLKQYLKATPTPDLKYLFCDLSTREQILGMDRRFLEDTIKVTRGYINDKSRVKLRYFFEGYGLRSCVLGTVQGTIQEGAETFDRSPVRQEEALVREIRGTVLQHEQLAFDRMFESSGTPKESYLRKWEADPEHYLFARNDGVYSAAEQLRIKGAKVAVIGLGCIGGIVAQSLARIGVQHLTLVDNDEFEPENINRQPYATFNTIGQSKAYVTEKELKKINPRIVLCTVPKGLTMENCDNLLRNADIVVQCVDDVATRILIHRKAREHKIPAVTMSGQPPHRGFVSTFLADGPVYEELMGLGDDISRIPTDQLLSEQNTKAFAECKLERARCSVAKFAQPCPKHDTMAAWLAEFAEGKKGWAVTFERTWIMAVLQAHEVVRFITGGKGNLLSPAPSAIIIDFSDPPDIVRVAKPSAGEKWAKDSHWDYRNF
jgi:molybdopterin/thiamine biosynthesis adenylyltransferase